MIKKTILFSFFLWGYYLQVFAQTIAEGRLENLGPQVTAHMIQGSLFIHDVDGKDYVYTVVRGEPAHLLGYDLKSKKLLIDEPLPKADGVWDLAYSEDGFLYIPGASGILFRHRPGTQYVESLGQALAGETYVWNLTTGRDGEVFGATYPGCRVFRYHPKDGFSDVGQGPLVPGENYVRSIVYHAKTDRLYAGIGSHAELIRLDPRSGHKEKLLPEAYRHKEFVYGLDIVTGSDGQERLLALLTSGRETLVYNLAGDTVEQLIENMDMKAVGNYQGHVYYTAHNELRSFDPSFSITQSKLLHIGAGSANAFSIFKDHLYYLNAKGKLGVYDLKRRQFEETQLEIPGQPIPINALMLGPDKKIWMGGYLAGGHATFDPASGISTELKGLDQTEGMVVSNDEIYFGIYPNGRFYRYDNKKPWIPETNPRKLGRIEGQGRSFALAAAPDKKKLYFGMIPEYGLLGGALVQYDTERDTLMNLGIPIRDQAITSLLYTGGKLWIGTTVSGGLGIRPSTTEAVLCAWDTDADTLEYVTVPIREAHAITALIEGSDMHLWGVAGGKLFVFDRQNKRVLEEIELYEQKPLGSHVWRGAFLINHPNGNVYGTVDNKLFKLDSVTRKVTFLHDGASLLTMDEQGVLYFRNKTDLWRYFPKN